MTGAGAAISGRTASTTSTSSGHHSGAPPWRRHRHLNCLGDRQRIGRDRIGDGLGDVAGIQQVWTTWTDPIFAQEWQSVLLAQSPGDPTQYTATFNTTDSNILDGGNFIVQAANGVGEVSLADNNGFYFTAGSLDNTGASGSTVAPSPNTYTLTVAASTTPNGTPVGTATYGSTVDLQATLAPNTGNTSSGTGVGDLVTFQIGNQSAYAVTGPGDTATTSLTLNQPTGLYTLAASYGGDTNDLAATDSESFTITVEPTSLQVSAPSELISGTAGDASGDQLSATLTSGATAIPFQTVVFDIENSNVVVASTTGETNGNGIADAQPFTVPAGDVGPYTVMAYYGQSASPPRLGMRRSTMPTRTTGRPRTVRVSTLSTPRRRR